MKKYKPGQFVSIGGKLARACKIKMTGPHVCCTTCVVCADENGHNDPCVHHVSECIKKLSTDCYPKFIKQCGNQDK